MAALIDEQGKEWQEQFFTFCADKWKDFFRTGCQVSAGFFCTEYNILMEIK